MPKHLLEGLKRFRADAFPRYSEHYARLVADGQKPSTLFIGCSDSRIVPTLLTDALPGELFIVRNVGAFVPPLGAKDAAGVGAAVEFALHELGVADVVVCGHSHCGAIRALYGPPPPEMPLLASWLELGREARLDEEPTESVLRRTERRAVALQLSRLMEFPLVRERVEAGLLAIHGWYYIIESGEIEVLDVARGEFVPKTS
ncbi:MAG TPA: carbonic anhydrase [Longimicrobiales bacterium]